jgi:phage terminase Nu1 subunit (DNA packaging protein)
MPKKTIADAPAKKGPGRPVAYLSEAELADVLEVDPRVLRRWRADGCPHVMRDSRVRYRLPQVVAWREERAVRALDADEAKERAAKMRADREITELKLARMRGELAPVTEMDEAVEALAHAVRNEIRGLRARFTGRIIGLQSHIEAAEQLDAMAASILSALVNAAREMQNDGDADAA